jgi:hypothetical protein
MSQTDTLERTAMVAYTLIQELHRVLADPHSPDEVTHGIILATAMFCDEKIGPFRTKRLMQAAPDIVLRWDAYVPMMRRLSSLRSCRPSASIFWK